MGKFTCQNVKCIESFYKDDEDIRLVLNIEDGVRHQYYVNEDATLEHYDSDGTGQEIYLECKVCGERYEFDYDLGYIFEQHVLPLNKRKLEEIEVRKSDKI